MERTLKFVKKVISAIQEARRMYSVTRNKTFIVK